MRSSELRSILVPLDGSEFSERALQRGLSLAKENAARLILVRVVTYSGLLTGELSAKNFLLEYDAAEAEAKEYLEARYAELQGQGVEVETSLVFGPPEDGILEVAQKKDVDLIVISTHGRSGLTRWFLGSVAEAVLRRANRPVLLLPPED